jgi:hypothetical protein
LSLSQALLLFNMNDLCLQLQRKYDLLMKGIERVIKEVWDYQVKSDEFNTSIENETTMCSISNTEFSKLGELMNKIFYSFKLFF